MLREITNWSDLQKALRARKVLILYCEDCKHVWISEGKELPQRCARRTCRAWANSPLRDGQVGRPAVEETS
jgi:hypothetical protein